MNYAVSQQEARLAQLPRSPETRYYANAVVGGAVCVVSFGVSTMDKLLRSRAAQIKLKRRRALRHKMRARKARRGW